jgi:hypothetical protein
MLRDLTNGKCGPQFGFTVAALCTLLFSACASPIRVAVPPGKAAELVPATGVVGLRQQEIGTSIDRSNMTAAMGGGLIFALVDAGINNSRAKKAEASAASIRDALVDYKPGDVLAKALQSSFTGTELPLGEVKVVQIKDATTLPQQIKGDAGKSVLVLDVAYELLPNLAGTRVTVFATLHPPAGKLKGFTHEVRKLPGACYFNVFSSVRRFPFSMADRPPGSPAELTSPEGELARQVLTDSFTAVAQMIAYDLAIPSRPENALYKPTATSMTLSAQPAVGPTGVWIRGYVEKAQAGRSWVRLPDGELCDL